MPKEINIYFLFTVIVILIVMRKHYQKDSLASMKNSGEIHEQLVTYDEEGGGEMDTNGYVDKKYTYIFHINLRKTFYPLQFSP